MGRLLRLSQRQRNVFVMFALLIALCVFIVSEYSIPRRVALSLDTVYDPPLTVGAGDTPSEDWKTPSPASSNVTLPRVLLVSAFYSISHPRASKGDYASALQRFLGPITTDIYLYTTHDLASSARSMRGSGLSITIDTAFSSPFDVPPLKGRETVYKQMHDVDWKKEHHSPELYALWNAKPYLLERAIEQLEGRRQSFDYDYVFWTDVDGWERQHAYAQWPDVRRLEMIWEEGSGIARRRKEDLMFFPIGGSLKKSLKYWHEDLGPVHADFVEGSFFGGPPTAVSWFSKTFYAYHDHYLALGFFSGKDSSIYNALAFLYPSRFIVVWASDPSAPARGGLPPNFIGYGYLGACGVERYYYQWWLSDRETRDSMKERWLVHAAEDTSISPGSVSAAWWKIRASCRLTRVLSVEEVLRRTFGKGWGPPAATVSQPRRIW